MFDQRYGWGIQVYPASDRVIVTGNTVVGNRRGGIVVGGEDGTTANRTMIVNNIVAYNDDSGIRGYYPGEGLPGRRRNVAYNNLAYHNGSGNFTNDDAPRKVIGFGRGNVSRNPRFVDLGLHNLRLRPGSPAINHALSRYSLSRDYDGKKRPQGEASDIGAFEFARWSLTLAYTHAPAVGGRIGQELWQKQEQSDHDPEGPRCLHREEERPY